MPRLAPVFFALTLILLNNCATSGASHKEAKRVAHALADPSGRPNLAIAQPVGGRCLSSGPTADIRCPVHDVDDGYLAQLTDPQGP